MKPIGKASKVYVRNGTLHFTVKWFIPNARLYIANALKAFM